MIGGEKAGKVGGGEGRYVKNPKFFLEKAAESKFFSKKNWCSSFFWKKW